MSRSPMTWVKRNPTASRLSSATLMALFALGLGASALAQQPAPTAVPVGTVMAEKRAITQTADFVGRIEAVNRVDIRARVTGYLEEVLFKDGATVAEGAPLFRIERSPFEAAVEQAQGALEKAQGALQNATVQRQRAEDLLKTSAGSVAIRDQRVAEEKGAQGDETTAAANLKTAQINLGYTEIKAPIAGRIGRTKLTKGNVVGPDTGVLVQIVSDDPMYVTFPVSQREFLALKTNRLPTNGSAPLVSLRFSDGSTYEQKGRVDFVDVSVERATDTVLVRATLPNPAGKLLDGTLVRVGVQADKSEEKVLVPQSALIADQQGSYVFAVEDGKAVVKRVKVGAEAGSYVVIEQGLVGNEQIVIQGLQNLRPGVPVLASPVTLTTGRS
ncbi:membrane fusion protein (multidrug efflux system) [Bosea sp. BE271]|nr:membrane fusion protein (multidrug efflux system) [Bosea robiniae]MDR6897039.1 membrane fusion protein (multidrug efflux system) [Bosea sp. BE109]MDR7140280.1 membrane fusion protein (multidrug efflux system) [Bosea sp. BE168]MDR7177133.1 membrane fusion protein (multidrug efflux system) [Bosea sp. BE271]